MTSQTLGSITPADHQRLLTTIEGWKRKLLDISKRNRALNFRSQRVSTVTIVDELPEAVFTKLWVEGVSMRFSAAETPAEAPAEAPAVASGDPLDDLLQGDEQTQPAVGHQLGLPSNVPPAEPAPSQPLYTEAEREDRYYDNILQTAAAVDKLDKSLRRLDDQTRLALEEQGVNLLFLALGMLHYKESADSAEIFRAPLVLLPVGLSRKSARTGYVVSATGDEAMVNPALVEYLRRSHGLALPDLPDAASMGDEYDLRTLLEGVRATIKDAKDWAVKDEIHLGLFSFQKFVMYKDVELNVAAIASHRLIRQLILRTGPQYDGLPASIQSLDLDQNLPPEHTFQVVDSDSSQLRAIAAVAKNFDLVMEGPPGTGKSQTITNLIALALASGRSVLFVAEKNAALKVVHQRLVKAGLGDFCLELHSTKANKRAVVHELARSLDASLQAPAVSATAAQRLSLVRGQLTEYVRQLHQPFGSLNLSPYQVFGRYGAVVNATRVKFSSPVESVSQEQVDQTVRELTELAQASDLVGDPQSHPWRETSHLFYTEDDFDAVSAACKQILAEVDTIDRLSAQAGKLLGRQPLTSPGDLQDFLTVAEVIARSPGAPPEVLANEAWDTAPLAEAVELIRRGRDLHQRIQAMEPLFKPSVYDIEHAADAAYVQAKTKGSRGLLALLDSHYRTIRKRWLDYRLPSYRGSVRVQAEHLMRIDQINLDRRQLAELEAAARQYFGRLWQNETSDWDALDKYITWVVEFRALYRRYGLGQGAIETAQSPAPDLSAVAQLEAAIATVVELLRSLGATIGWPENYLSGAKFAEIETRARSLAENLSQAHQWAAFVAVRTRAAQGLAGEMVTLAMDGQIGFAALAAVFQRAFYQKWLATVVSGRRPLFEFNTLMHEQRVTEFKELDRSILTENRNSLIRKVRDDVQKKMHERPAAEVMPFLRREIARQRGLSPLRRTLKQAGAAIRAIKPCFMMSPLTVAQLLDASQPSFDLVIFDEASQLPAEDAVGAISRGKQLVVVGDPKQLPPTNFFGVMNGQVSASVGEDGMPLYEDGESILEELMGAGLPTSRLKWHYRSAHESLIQFSNVSFYDSDLYTFPSVEFASDELGVRFEYIANGVYEGKGLNLIEARRVAQAVAEHARTSPLLSLGVGTFNMRQQLAIQDEIERRRRLDPELDAFCSQNNNEPFFVKNLENIQGDERDVIFISVTYGKGLDGRLRYNFGPINGENGWRRLNVLASRARRRMKVFSSIRADDISPVGLTSAGAQLLRNFLMYVEHGRFDKTDISKSTETESPFERDVYLELTRQGVSVAPQVGVAGYRIDLGVLDDTLPGRYVCGIECDGVTYHASETARDRDRLRQQVLEERGWLIHRIWSTDWFKDRKGQVVRIMDLIQQAREKVKADVAARAAAGKNVNVNLNPETSNETDRFDMLVGPTEDNGGPDPAGYIRPAVPPYRFADSQGVFQGHDILEAPISQIAGAVVSVVKIEGPVHLDDLIVRIVGFWGTKAGKRIVEHIKEACAWAVRTKSLVRKGDFFYAGSGAVSVRSRNGLRSAPERIALEEYREAVLLVLRTGYVFSRKKLASEARALLGFGRTTATLEDLIGRATDDLRASGIAGDASSGVTLRSRPL